MVHKDLPYVQVAAANLRFGEGVTREVGMDFKNMNARKVRGNESCTAYRIFRSRHAGRRIHRSERREASSGQDGM